MDEPYQHEEVKVLDGSSSCSDDDDVQVWHEHDTLQNGLRDLRSTGHLFDVTLIAREQRFQAHRVVLAAVSPYFLSMFTCDMLEAQQTEARLNGITPATLEELIEFAYTSKVRLTASNVQNLLVAAHFLQISCVVEACSQYMQSRLEVSNVVNIFQMAIAFSCRALEDAAENFIVRIFTAVAQTEEFHSLPHPIVARILSHNALSIPDGEDEVTAAQVSNVAVIFQIAVAFSFGALENAAEEFILRSFTAVAQTEGFLSLPHPLVARILSHNDLSIGSEKDVYKAAVAWVKTDVDSRKELMASLLSLVRLPLLKPAYLTKTVASEELIRNSVGCQELLNKAIDYHTNPGNRRSLLQTFIVRPRCCYDEPSFIVAVGGTAQWTGGPPETVVSHGLNSVEVYDTILGEWASLEVPGGKSLHPKRSTFGVAVLDGLLYAIGGWSNADSFTASQVVEVFSPAEGKWNQRSECGAVVCAGKLYVCGGRVAEDSPLPSVECYNPETKSWVLLNGTQSQMITHRGDTGVAALDGKIYVVGGHGGAHFDRLTILDSVECFDAETEQWTNRKPMGTCRHGLGAAVLNGKIYACGGYSGKEDLASVECYDPLTDQWTMVASMNTRRCGLSVVANCGKLYAIGGSEEGTMLSSMEIYSPEENVWRLGPYMKSHKGYVGVGLVPINTDH